MLGVYVLLAVAALWFYFSSKKKIKGKPLPGPRGLPIVGKGFDITQENLHVKLSEYADTYGDIVQVKVFKDTLVCLNSAELIRKAFNDYPYKKFMNDRYLTYWGQNILYNSESIVFYQNPFDGVHGDLRKGFTQAMHVYGDGIKDFEDMVVKELNRLQEAIDNKRGEDFEFVAVIKRSLTNIISYLLSGEDIEDGDEDVDLFWQFNEVDETMLSASTNTMLLTFPFLVKLPGYYKKLYEDSTEARARILNKYFYRIRDSHQPGVIRGIVDFLLDEQIRDTEAGRDILFTDERIMNIIMDTISAGILTTLSYVTSTILCLVNNPECQERIQNEVDEVIGPHREPTLADRTNCPFLEAAIMESSRCLPITPLSVPHYCSTDIEFEGFHVPAGSTIVSNIWYVHHDVAVWGDPWTFRPERWLDVSGQTLSRTHPLRKHWLTFGTGRRQCVGEQFGRNRMFLYMATLLKNYTFTATPGKCGPCDPRKGNFDVSLIMRPKPFYLKADRRY